MSARGRLLTHMLGGIVYSLSRPDHLRSGLKRLCENHVNYRVREDHYPIIKEAMLFAIREIMGDRRTNNTLDALNAALDFIINAMLRWEEL